MINNISLYEAFKYQIEKYDNGQNVPLSESQINMSFDEYKSKHNEMYGDNSISLSDMELKELFEVSKNYFDGEPKKVGDRVLFFLLMQLKRNDNKKAEIYYEMYSIPERRLSFYKDKLIVDLQKYYFDTSDEGKIIPNLALAESGMGEFLKHHNQAIIEGKIKK